MAACDVNGRRCMEGAVYHEGMYTNHQAGRSRPSMAKPFRTNLTGDRGAEWKHAPEHVLHPPLRMLLIAISAVRETEEKVTGKEEKDRG
ncbi:hypothetical protein EYF80_042975 [Liparis tanakae]|uniref:Uncharacterized protein n=1 Tax=Liparis tanakae TaxID=230148 RepID=A0A4Z2G136_9TELE|nr:hypothetical protein EYF80_042975 [Liparis tanakae]